MEEHEITNLPWNLLNTILLQLPLKEVVKTSILSKNWRYNWTGLSEFVIDDKCLSSCAMDKVARGKVVMKIIQLVQSKHAGPIEKFKLAAYCNQIIQYFDTIRLFKLPSSLLCCSHLTRLELFACDIKLSNEFKGLERLAILHLTQVHIDSETLRSLIENCCVLERLTLSILDNRAVLRIHNPKLRYLKIDSDFEAINLGNCPSLATVDIRLRRHVDFFLSDGIPAQFPSGFKHLYHLLVIDLKEVKLDGIVELFIIICILAYDSPNVASAGIVTFLWTEHWKNLMFEHLRAVKITGISTFESAAWEFIKFLLFRSPALETITLIRYRDERVPQALFEQLPRASQYVKVTSFTSKYEAL
ncbi:F-box/FBD/LRR-repeat protein At1g13570 [Ziziphus jujuba]|uniref:F-box/FBD/LRR-repeat protein At1g13570 n=1 Tax=Ziziphus jujuba TaxID=326968 RepID=A0ABM4A7V8_ZIZJJ|nr:F-box/FBD/LRR-repeat protein At1g13570 [Ziziphus jujuba]